MTLDLQVQQPSLPRGQRILAVFEANGRRMTLRDLAQACIDEGIWSQSELDQRALRFIEGECRKTLREHDAAGLPKNGQSTECDDDGRPVWVARQFWTFDDYSLNIREHVDQRNENHTIAKGLADEAEARYGRPIALPELPA